MAILWMWQVLPIKADISMPDMKNWLIEEHVLDTNGGKQLPCAATDV